MFSVLMLYFLILENLLYLIIEDCNVLLHLYEIVFMTNQRVPQILFHLLRCGFV